MNEQYRFGPSLILKAFEDERGSIVLGEASLNHLANCQTPSNDYYAACNLRKSRYCPSKAAQLCKNNCPRVNGWEHRRPSLHNVMKGYGALLRPRQAQISFFRSPRWAFQGAISAVIFRRLFWCPLQWELYGLSSVWWQKFYNVNSSFIVARGPVTEDNSIPEGSIRKKFHHRHKV